MALLLLPKLLPPAPAPLTLLYPSTNRPPSLPLTPTRNPPFPAVASASAQASALGGASSTANAVAQAVAQSNAGTLNPQCIPLNLAQANAQARAAGWSRSLACLLPASGCQQYQHVPPD